MKITPFQAIGQKIVEIKYSYIFENNFALQEFYSYFKLSNGSIIQIPNFVDEFWDSADDQVNNNFQNANIVDRKILDMLKNKEIIDFHFLFYENTLDEESKAFIELENNIFITEKNFGPLGLTDIDLKIFSQKEFKEIKNNLEQEYQLKSLLNDILYEFS